MEQQLLDPSKYTIKLYSLDSRFASGSQHNKGEFRINLPHTLKNIMRIRMASSEIPFVEYQFSAAKGNTTFAVRLGAATTFTKATPIPDGNYATGQALADAVEVSLKSLDAGFSCDFDATTGLVTIKHATTDFSIFLTSFNQETARRDADWGLGYNLGFPKGILNAVADGGAYYAEAARPAITQTTQYYLLQLECPEAIENVVHPTKDKGFLGGFAKLILRGDTFTANFDDNSNLMRKEHTFLAPASIPFFVCRLLDAWGEVVDMQERNWSLTLEITEVVNSKTHSTLARTYAR